MKFLNLKLFGKGRDNEIDPVCHMEVNPSKASGGTAEHEGKTYYFCAPGCRVAFSKEPAKYLSADWKGMGM